MARILNTAFEARSTNKAFDQTLNITGMFVDGVGQPEICAAGFLTVKKGLLDLEGYPTGTKNGNSWSMIAATSAHKVNTPIFACNTGNVNEVANPQAGTLYRVGPQTLGLEAPAGELVTYTKIEFDGNKVYRFGIGNLSAALSTNKFATIDDGLLTPAAAAPTSNGAVYFEILGTGTFTEGPYNSFGFVDVLPRFVAVGA